jgi:hypothetical protein
MEYLVEMKQGTFTKSSEEGITFIEIYVLPTLAIAKRQIGLAFIIMLNPLRRLMKF